MCSYQEALITANAETVRWQKVYEELKRSFEQLRENQRLSNQQLQQLQEHMEVRNILWPCERLISQVLVYRVITDSYNPVNCHYLTVYLFIILITKWVLIIYIYDEKYDLEIQRLEKLLKKH